MLTAEDEGRVANRTKHSSELLRHPPVSTAPEAFADWVEDTCARRGVAAILPLDDEVVLTLASRARPRVGGAILVGPTVEQYQVLCDKAALAEASRAAGFTASSQVIVTCDGRSGDWPPLPCIVKPRAPGMAGLDGLVTTKPVLVHTVDQRDGAVRQLIESVGEAMVEEHLSGPAWRVHFVRSATKTVSLVVRSVRAYPPRTGQSSVQRVDGHDPALAALAQRLLDSVSYIGPGSVQAIRTDTGYVVHDVNLRLPVSVGVSINAGLDMPAFAVAVALGKSLPDEPLASRKALYVSLLGESSQLLDGIRGRDVAARPSRVLLDIGSALFARHGILDPVDLRDPLPIFLGMGEMLRRRLRRERQPIRWAKSV